jgi:hypothetical protein
MLGRGSGVTGQPARGHKSQRKKPRAARLIERTFGSNMPDCAPSFQQVTIDSELESERIFLHSSGAFILYAG